MKGKLFTEIQFGLVISGKKTSFWERVNEKRKGGFPAYEIDEILYLKEPYKIKMDDSTGEKNILFLYQYNVEYPCDKTGVWEGYYYTMWKNKLFMPETAARYFIQITGVRKESLGEINCRDCIEKGLAPEKCHKYVLGEKQEGIFVWVYEFRLMDADRFKKDGSFLK